VRHVRPPRPIRFPAEEEVPEGITHLRLRTFLWQLLEAALGPEHTVGSDQFIYWNARDPKRCLSPDVYVCLGVPQTSFYSWQTWRHGGAPQLAIELISPHEWDGIAWDEKVLRYHELGVSELVRFDPLEPEGRRLRAWDRVDDDFVERVVDGDRTPCVTLSLEWIVVPVAGEPVGLRLADAKGKLVESRDESLARTRFEEKDARAAAEARVRELEAELLRRG
jgi:Uma2 family endonuclease